MRIFTIIIWLYLTKQALQEGILYPQESETREIHSLDGLWNFAVSRTSDADDTGLNERWFENDLSKLKNVDVHLMPVPSSYNDIVTNLSIRDQVGLVWYDKTFFIPKSWSIKRVCLRFSSVSYSARVWINGKLAMKHEIGHLPFQSDITTLLHFGNKNRVTVACDNRLTESTVPQGLLRDIHTDEGKKTIQTFSFDFFNYAGIQRSVVLYATPKSYIDDISVKTDIIGTAGKIYYNVTYFNAASTGCTVSILSKNNIVLSKHNSLYGTGIFAIHDAKFWWPYFMHPEPGYLYTLQVELRSARGELIDVYRLPVGIREISWSNSKLCINKRPIYFTGFGRHEDSDIRGRGFDLAFMMKDHYLLKWMGANSYRTSHYPYAEEAMDLADRLGIMIIDECPSVKTKYLSSTHFRSKNHSSLNRPRKNFIL